MFGVRRGPGGYSSLRETQGSAGSSSVAKPRLRSSPLSHMLGPSLSSSNNQYTPNLAAH